MDIDDFDEACKDLTPTEIACGIIYGKFNHKDDYFKFNNSNSLVSLSDKQLKNEIKYVIELIINKIKDGGDYSNLLPDSIRILIYF